MKFAGGLTLAAALALAGPALGADATELLFDTQHLDGAGSGEIRYRHAREMSRPLENAPNFNGDVTVTVSNSAEGVRIAEVRIDSPVRRRTLDPFEDPPGNPLLMVFLESTVSSVSKATGGSPFYIRNRIKDALRGLSETESVPAAGDDPALEQAVVKPFEGDKNRVRMGDFAELEIIFSLSDKTPGMFHSLVAQTPDREGTRVYAERISYDGRETD